MSLKFRLHYQFFEKNFSSYFQLSDMYVCVSLFLGAPLCVLVLITVKIPAFWHLSSRWIKSNSHTKNCWAKDKLEQTHWLYFDFLPRLTSFIISPFVPVPKVAHSATHPLSISVAVIEKNHKKIKEEKGNTVCAAMVGFTAKEYRQESNWLQHMKQRFQHVQHVRINNYDYCSATFILNPTVSQRQNKVNI